MHWNLDVSDIAESTLVQANLSIQANIFSALSDSFLYQGVNRKPFTWGRPFAYKNSKLVNYVGIGILRGQKWQKCF